MVIMVSVGFKMINDLDKRLLAFLNTNARMSVSDLARGLDLSRSTVQNKILKFFPNADFDSYKLGFDSVNDRQNFDAVDDFIERGYKPAFYNVKDLP